MNPQDNETKYKTKYRIASTRLQSWDYGWNGSYFITICTANMNNYFGNVVNGKMNLSEIGQIANELWKEILQHVKNVKLGEFMVMPNHVHGIINLINNNDDNVNVETRHALSLQSQQTIGKKRFQNQGKNTISSIIGSFKSAVTKQAHERGFEFKWQSQFYDHIIRNEKSYQNISNYIIDNPVNWNDDEYNNVAISERSHLYNGEQNCETVSQIELEQL